MQQPIRTNTHRVGIDKAGRAMKRLDFIGPHLLFPAPAFVSRDVLLVAHEIRDGRLSSKGKIDAKELARTPAGKSQRGFAQRLARDRSGIDSGSADFAQFLNQRDALAENRRRIRSADSGWPAADYHKVVGLDLH